MTESPIRDLAAGIVAELDAMKSWAPQLAAIVARLRECGLDHEATKLEAQARRRETGLKAIARLADGLLDDTAVGMDLDLVANEAHADDE